MLTLKMVVDRYTALAGQAGAPVALSDFGWSPSETEKMFNGFDEDYHISRYLHFSKSEGRSYAISGEEVTHIAIDANISSLF
jgi:hypothetical protein